MRKQYRQGDVFIEEIDSTIPEGAVEVPREREQVILAHGEATGHAHAFRGGGAIQFAHGERRLLTLVRDGVLYHEEHHQPSQGKVIELRQGNHEITRQEEYIEGELRQVAD